MSTNCIEHSGYRDKLGYGKCSFMGTYTTVHRREWIRQNGPIAGGLYVLHKCDNPSCYNIEHLYLGTQKDNIRDQHERKRSRWHTHPLPSHCKRGHEFTPENTYMSKAGSRSCKTCKRERQRRKPADAA